MTRVSAENVYGVSSPIVGPPHGVVVKYPFDPPTQPGTPEILEYHETNMILEWEKPKHDGGNPIQGNISLVAICCLRCSCILSLSKLRAMPFSYLRSRIIAFKDSGTKGFSFHSVLMDGQIAVRTGLYSFVFQLDITSTRHMFQRVFHFQASNWIPN